MNRETARVAERFADASVELAACRTDMAFERTRMSADRTLMAVIRTSLALIGFGFTLFQVFQKLHLAGVLRAGREPRDSGLALVGLGLLMLALGIVHHLRFWSALHARQRRLVEAQLAHASGASTFSPALVAAVVLGMLGVLAIASMAFSAPT